MHNFFLDQKWPPHIANPVLAGRRSVNWLVTHAFTIVPACLRTMQTSLTLPLTRAEENIHRGASLNITEQVTRKKKATAIKIKGRKIRRQTRKMSQGGFNLSGRVKTAEHSTRNRNNHNRNKYVEREKKKGILSIYSKKGKKKGNISHHIWHDRAPPASSNAI